MKLKRTTRFPFSLENVPTRPSKRTIQLMIDKGANVNAQNKKKETPLHLAALSGFHEVIDLLVQKGADLNALTIGNMTPLDYANYTNETKAAQVLISHGAKTAQELPSQ